LTEQEEGTKAYILAPIHSFEKYGFERQISLLIDQGYARLLVNKEVYDLTDKSLAKLDLSEAKLVIDRISVQQNEEFEARISDSISLAFAEGLGTCEINYPEKERPFNSPIALN
jgi:excinuclease ABC subunit A